MAAGDPPGDAMLFDNWRVLHGRTAYTGHRHLCGAYVNREDFESRRHVLTNPRSGGMKIRVKPDVEDTRSNEVIFIT